MQIAIKKVILRSVSKNAMKLFVHYSTLFFIAFLSMELTKEQAFKLTIFISCFLIFWHHFLMGFEFQIQICINLSTLILTI